MKRRLLNILPAVLLAAVFSCSSNPEPINFGTDQCDLCRMTITDVKFGAEIVTKKGKVHKFDAAECMINALSTGKFSRDDAAGFYVIDASNPKNLTDAVKASYLISDKFPSPMGADLSAFANRTSAEEFHKKFGGELKSWDELMAKFKVN